MSDDAHDASRPPVAMSRVLWPVVLVVVTLIAYWPALRGGWIWDDDYYVTGNVTLRSLDGLARIWTEIGAVPQYYPVTHTTFWLEWHLWGDRPLGYHVVNVLLHCSSAILIGVILRRLAVPGWWIVPWLFALHPVQVESVAWVTERKNVLSGFFYLLALASYLHFAGTTRALPPRWKWYAISITFFACALLSKSVTSSLPAVVLLIIYWKRGRIALRDVLPLVPFFVFGMAMGALTSWMERHVVGAQGSEFAFSVADRILIAGRAVWFYVTKLLWPHPLIFMYPRWRIDDHAAWQYVFPVSVALAIAALWVLRTRIGRGPLVAGLFFCGSLVPALGFVNVLPMRYSFVADHFQYLASLGLITLLAAVVATYIAPRYLVPMTVIACLLLAVLTFRHAKDFTDLETLWVRTLEKNPSSWMAHNNYGTLLLTRRDYPAAAEQFRRTIELKPDHDQARLNLGMIAERQGRPAEARRMYLDAIRVRPDFANAYYNLAALTAAQGKPYDAIALYEQAIKLDPKHVDAYTNLGLLFAAQDNRDRANEAFRRALQINPDAVPARIGLGNLLLEAEQFDAAMAEFGRAEALQPGNPVVRNNIGIALAARGRLDDAERAFQEALDLKPDYVGAMTNLGIVRVRKNDVAGARRWFTRALALEPGNQLARRQLDALPSDPSP